MSSDQYTPPPEERDFIDSWACRHVEYDIPADERADVARAFLARVRRDAAREALDGLDPILEALDGAENADGIYWARDALAAYRDAHYPEEIP